MNIVARIKEEIKTRKDMYGEYGMSLDELLEFIDQLERGVVE